ncbi:hypothetical protein FB451DRAFT_1567530 [Mycena latifolia]|nr:hypothetical protein FB451DRAFT_1567530 [Mycena latifolia]
MYNIWQVSPLLCWLSVSPNINLQAAARRGGPMYDTLTRPSVLVDLLHTIRSDFSLADARVVAPLPGRVDPRSPASYPNLILPTTAPIASSRSITTVPASQSCIVLKISIMSDTGVSKPQSQPAQRAYLGIERSPTFIVFMSVALGPSGALRRYCACGTCAAIGTRSSPVWRRTPPGSVRSATSHSFLPSVAATSELPPRGSHPPHPILYNLTSIVSIDVSCTLDHIGDLVVSSPLDRPLPLQWHPSRAGKHPDFMYSQYLIRSFVQVKFISTPATTRYRILQHYICVKFHYYPDQRISL